MTERVPTCGDCIHADLCERDVMLPEFSRKNAAYCDEFRAAADFVEVVRCKDCEQWMRNRGIVDSQNGHCFYLDTETNGYDFCSYGERRVE